MNQVFFFIVNVDWFFLSHRLQLALAIKAKGYDVFVITKNTGKRNIIESHGFKFIEMNFERSGTNFFKEFLILIKLIILFRKFNPFIIHNVTIKPAIYSSIALKFYRKPVKFINAVSGLGYNFVGDRNSIIQRILKRIMRFAYKGEINFIFQNPDDMELYGKMGLLRNNNFRIIKGAGVDCDVFKYHDPILKDKIEIVLISRMILDKGILEYIGAAKFLLEKWKDRAIFKLIGDVDDAYLSSLSREEINMAVIPGYIEWIGYANDVKPFLISSDIACLPSYREGLPKFLIEAMAIGRPIVATDVPGCRECVDDGINGFLVPSHNIPKLAEALDTLMENRKVRTSMGIASREKMTKELSLAKVVSETIEYYDEI